MYKKHLKTKKIALYAGLMIFVFMVILILIIVSVGISFLGLGALSPESMKELSLNMENLSGVNHYMGYQFYSPPNLVHYKPDYKMAYCAEVDESFISNLRYFGIITHESFSHINYTSYHFQ
jgi:hypothetical protein